MGEPSMALSAYARTNTEQVSPGLSHGGSAWSKPPPGALQERRHGVAAGVAGGVQAVFAVK